MTLYLSCVHESGGEEEILLAMPVLLIIQSFYSSFHKLL